MTNCDRTVNSQKAKYNLRANSRITMFAYCVKAFYPDCRDHSFEMIIYHNGSKRDVETYLGAHGWRVKRIKLATMVDISEVGQYEDVLKNAKAEGHRLRKIEEENRKRIAIENEKRAEDARKAAAAREKAAEENRDLAISRAAGDLFSLEPEPNLLGNVKVISICAKILLFFGQASLNKKDLFTAISIDFAEFQAQSQFPQTAQLLAIILSDLNNFLGIDEQVASLNQRLNSDRVSVENRVNSIGSRSHIFGGSGEFLLLSYLDASMAARSDQKAIDSLESAHVARARQVMHATEQAQMRQHLLEFRAKSGVSILLVACGKANSIKVDMPIGVEQYVLNGGNV